MLGHAPFYHGIIRKSIVAFGALFSDIRIERKEGDSVTGITAQTIQVPLAYGCKEKWLVRIEQDATQENYTYTSLPRMSFEILGYNYDAVRKTNRMSKITCGSGLNSMSTVNSYVPYNLDIALYILTKTQEDALQIIEQILPTFTPEYTLSINAVPDMNIVQDIPIILNNISVQDDYDGDFQMRRFVTHTLTFTVKLNLFGGISPKGVITKVIADINDVNTNQLYSHYEAVGNPSTGAVTSESWLEHF